MVRYICEIYRQINAAFGEASYTTCDPLSLIIIAYTSYWKGKRNFVSCNFCILYCSYCKFAAMGPCQISYLWTRPGQQQTMFFTTSSTRTHLQNSKTDCTVTPRCGRWRTQPAGNYTATTALNQMSTATWDETRWWWAAEKWCLRCIYSLAATLEHEVLGFRKVWWSQERPYSR